MSIRVYEEGVDEVEKIFDTVFIYGRKGCKFCDAAKELMELKEIEYRYIDIEENTIAMEWLKNEGFKTVPVVYRNHEYIGGYAELMKKYI